MLTPSSTAETIDQHAKEEANIVACQPWRSKMTISKSSSVRRTAFRAIFEIARRSCGHGRTGRRWRCAPTPIDHDARTTRPFMAADLAQAAVPVGQLADFSLQIEGDVQLVDDACVEANARHQKEVPGLAGLRRVNEGTDAGFGREQRRAAARRGRGRGGRSVRPHKRERSRCPRVARRRRSSIR